FDRGEYWQCAYIIAKGQYEAVKARGLPALLDDIVRMAPVLKSGIADVKSFDDVKRKRSGEALQIVCAQTWEHR
uniref:hypothetical protein n=1 Tax=Pseudomonas sp. JAI120 TaxID=2723063 RepID=UPI0030EF4486